MSLRKHPEKTPYVLIHRHAEHIFITPKHLHTDRNILCHDMCSTLYNQDPVKLSFLDNRQPLKLSFPLHRYKDYINRYFIFGLEMF